MSGEPEELPAQRTQIAAEILRVHMTSYGTGAEEVIVLIEGLELSLVERTLIDGGDSATVLRTRAAFQEAIEPTFSQIVERATGRRVAGFLSTTNLVERCSVELFRLDPASA